MRWFLASAAALLAFVSVAATTSDPVGDSARVRAAMDHAAERYVSDPCHAGLSVVVRADGGTWIYGYGVIRRGGRPPSPDSVYELASVTKTFVGALAAQALLAGRMTLDGDFRNHLWGGYPNLSLDGVPITLRNLATHTSGLQRDLPDSDALFTRPDYDRLGGQLAALNARYGRRRSLAELHAVRLRAKPGVEFAYSNIGIGVIGYGLESVYGESLDVLLRKGVLTPLGMRDTSFRLSPSVRTRLVTPYGRSGRVQPYHDQSAGAAYGLYSTPRDMARYLEWHLDGADPVVARAHELIRGTSVEGQALIWNVGKVDNTRMLWHGGGSFGETSQMVLFPDERLGVVLLANDACEGSEAALKANALAIRRELRQ